MQRVVGVGEMQLSANPAEHIVTYALGSCVGLVIYDPVVRVGGLLHAQLPQSSISPEKALLNPAMFIDTGVPALFKAAYALGARKERIVVCAAGGASPTAKEDGRDFFQIGGRNVTALRQLLWRNGVLMKRYDLGGVESRTVVLDLATGEVRVRMNGEFRTLSHPAPATVAEA
jgi:chemotaxis protein CheD